MAAVTQPHLLPHPRYRRPAVSGDGSRDGSRPERIPVRRAPSDQRREIDIRSGWAGLGTEPGQAGLFHRQQFDAEVP